MIRTKMFCLAMSFSAMCFSAQAFAVSNYDLYTDARARAAKEALEYSLDQYESETDIVEMYTSTQLNDFVEQGIHLEIVEKRDSCQFTPDIEDRARIVGMPVFEFVFADMLINGRCVKQDVELGLDYFNRALKQGYAPALERMSFYYEKGYYVGKDLNKSELYMKTAASLGSISARLGWADMLIRGYGNPSMYEEAYSWLHHSYYSDLYRKEKSDYIKSKLEEMMPENIVVRAMVQDHTL